MNFAAFRQFHAIFHISAFPFFLEVNCAYSYAVAGGCSLRNRDSSSVSASNFFNNS